ncbi:MAG: hypothetical protein RLZZ161_1907 [Bacteroidota bacterium]
MKARDEVRLRALRNIKSAFLLLDTAGGNVSDEDRVKALQKMAKQRKDSIDIFEKEGRQDLADKEKEELEIIETFLPAQLSESEIEANIRAIMAETGAEGMKDLGKVMPLAMKAMAGKADGKLISEKVKALLNG